MENIFATDDLTDATRVFLLSVWSSLHVQNQELECFMQQHTGVTEKKCSFPQRGSITRNGNNMSVTVMCISVLIHF